VCGSWNKKESAWRVTRRASAVTGARTRPALCRESPRNAGGPHYSAPRRKNSVSRWHPARPQDDSQPDQAQRASSQRRQACQAKHWQSPGDSLSPCPCIKAGRVASYGAVGDKPSGEGGWRPGGRGCAPGGHVRHARALPPCLSVLPTFKAASRLLALAASAARRGEAVKPEGLKTAAGGLISRQGGKLANFPVKAIGMRVATTFHARFPLSLYVIRGICVA
jgi:hypothetical protein